MARFGINAEHAYGVSMTATRPLERRLRRNHPLALELWATGVHEPASADWAATAPKNANMAPCANDVFVMIPTPTKTAAPP